MALGYTPFRVTFLREVRRAPFSRTLCPACLHGLRQSMIPAIDQSFRRIEHSRPFSSSTPRRNWLEPKRKLTFKDPKGRPRMATGGSTRGTTIQYGDYGLRLKDHDRRISAAQLRNGEEAIRRRLRGYLFKIYPRVHASTAVFVKGNETRMGTGKGSFDHWASRVAISRIVFEIKAEAHEQVIRDALRLAANKLPGLWEFVKKGDPPVMGITPLANGITGEYLKNPRKMKYAKVLTPTRLPRNEMR